jgi:TolB-like protein
MIQLLVSFLIIFSCALFLGGCSKRYSDLPAFSPFPIKNYPNNSVGRFKSSYVAEQIEEFYQGSDPGPIGVTTLVNLDDLSSTSTFGRLYSEQILSELSMRGFQVIELRHADAVKFLPEQGEFVLSRDISSIQRTRELGALVTGTYVASAERVYVNVRIIDPASSVVLSVGSVEMEKTEELSKMLKGKLASGRTLERVSVRGDEPSYPTLFPHTVTPSPQLPINPPKPSQQGRKKLKK